MKGFIKHKKWITYGLGLLVIGIWGIVLQRIFAAADPAQRQVAQQLQETGGIKAKLPILQPDTFSLLLYKDPFAEDQGAEPADNSAAAETPIAPIGPKPQMATSPLDQVIYLGYILNPQTKKRVAILQAEGREHMVQEGKAVNQMKLLRVETDEIQMSYKGRTKQIKRKL